ncbi:MAG: hypothetical protein ACOCPN_04355 [Desulfonatronovibrionaceae bacterium]
MNSSTHCFLLEAQAIHLDNPALFWAREPDQAFVRGIEHLGQLEPVLISRTHGQATLLAGFKRCLALGRLGRKIMALEIKVSDPFQKGLIYLLSNRGKALDHGRLISALRYFSGLNRLDSQIYSELGLEPGSRAEKLWLAWLELPVQWDRFLARGSICLESASALKRFCPEDLQALGPFFENLGWSKSNCLKFLDLIRETKTVQGLCTADLIQKLKLQTILDSDLSPKDKTNSIISALTTALYPVFTAMKKDTHKRLRSLAAGTGWKLSHPDNFESTRIHVSASVSSRADLKKAVHELQKIADSPEWESWPINPHEY